MVAWNPVRRMLSDKEVGTRKPNFPCNTKDVNECDNSAFKVICDHISSLRAHK